MPLEISHVLLHSYAGGRAGVKCGKNRICIHASLIRSKIGTLLVNEIGETPRPSLHCPLLRAKTLRRCHHLSLSLSVLFLFIDRSISLFAPILLLDCDFNSARVSLVAAFVVSLPLSE